MATFVCPTQATVPRILADSKGIERSLFRYYGQHLEGRNVYYLTDGSVTEVDPDGTVVTWADVKTTWWGGHEAVTITAAESAALTAAGFTVT